MKSPIDSFPDVVKEMNEEWEQWMRELSTGFGLFGEPFSIEPWPPLLPLSTAEPCSWF
jgi:hypothetical protein